MGLVSPAHSTDGNGPANLGVDYAFLNLMALSPDIAAANYTIRNKEGTDVKIAIARIPYHLELMKNLNSRLQLELALAYQQTTQTIPVVPQPEENIDSTWTTFGSGIGLLYEHNITQHLLFTPSFRLSYAETKNRANYNGIIANSLKITFDNTLFNWESSARVLNYGLGMSYNWKLLDRASSVKINAYHFTINSFDESNSANKFNESANMLTVEADMIFPTHIKISDKRLDLTLLLGSNHFFGKNRNTLGYTTSYKAGFGAELPLKWGKKQYGHIRASSQFLWARNMEGWLVSVGYNSD